MFSENDIKINITLEKYNRWLKTSLYKNDIKKTNDWDPKTAACGVHIQFVIEQLNFKTKVFTNFIIVTENNINDIINKLKKGYLINLSHRYKNPYKFDNLPKDNRYGNHTFNIIKGGNKYFITQGFLHSYKHSLTSYSEDEIRKLLYNIITQLCDYNDNKKWGDLNLELYEKYFKTPLFMYPKQTVLLNRLVHNVILKYDTYKK